MALASIYCLFNDDYQQSKAKELLQSAYEIHKTCEGPYSTKTIKAQVQKSPSNCTEKNIWTPDMIFLIWFN